MNRLDSQNPKGRQRFPPILRAQPFVEVNRKAISSFVLGCDHATPALPEDYGTLGLDRTMFHRHIAFDIGAAELTYRLSELLDAPAVLSTFSRLLIDPNRSLDDPTLIVKSSDGVFIPGNQAVDDEDLAIRVENYHRPYHAAIAARIERARAAGKVPAFVGIHSFTPVMHGDERPWEVAILWNRDPRLARALLARLNAEEGLCVGENEPYSGRIAGHSMNLHGGAQGFPNAVVEVRQDLIDTHHGVEHWGKFLAGVIADVANEPDLFTVEHH